MAPYQGFVAAPGIVAVLDSVVAGAIAGIAGLASGADTGLTLGLGGAAFFVCLAGFAAFAVRAIAAGRRSIVVRFPS
jgi:hypothetical protein